RHPDQGRSRFDGSFARSARAALGSSRGRLLLEPAAGLEGAAGRRKISPAPGPRALCAARADRSAEDGLRRADRFMATRAVARMGGQSAEPSAPEARRHSGAGAHCREMARASERYAQLALSALGRADVPGVERALAAERVIRPSQSPA